MLIFYCLGWARAYPRALRRDVGSSCSEVSHLCRCVASRQQCHHPASSRVLENGTVSVGVNFAYLLVIIATTSRQLKKNKNNFYAVVRFRTLRSFFLSAMFRACSAGFLFTSLCAPPWYSRPATKWRGIFGDVQTLRKCGTSGR